MKPIIMFGTGKIADVALKHILRDRAFDVVACTVDGSWLSQNSSATSWQGLPVVAFEEIERLYPPTEFGMLVAIGYHGLNSVRQSRCKIAREMGYRLESYVSPRADVGDWLEIGDNCIILDSVGIQPGVKIGNNVSIWNNSLIGHHSTIEDDCWVAAGATLGGMVRLGASSFVGLNATVAGEVTLGAECFLGASALVTKSADARSVFVEPSSEKLRLDSRQFIRMTVMSAIGSSES